MHPGRCLRNSAIGRALVGVILITLAVAAVRHRKPYAPATPQASALQGELSMVQIEQMRVLAPNASRAAELVDREEQLKKEQLEYALLTLGNPAGVSASAKASVAKCTGAPVPVPGCVSSSSGLLRALERCTP